MKTRIANVVQILALLSMLAVLFGFFGKWHFLPDLASHFRVQATVSLLLAAPLLYFLKSRRWALVSATAGLGLLLSLWPFLVPHSVERGEKTYRLLSLNVWTNNPHHELVIETIVAHDPDFILLLETDARWIKSLDVALAEKWPHRTAEPRSDNFGIALYSKTPWSSCEVIEFDSPLPLPSIDARFVLSDGKRLRLIGTHPLPPMNASLWDARNSALLSLSQQVRAVGSERTIVAGDLNCSPWSHWFGRLTRNSGLRNSAEGHGLNFTWTPIGVIPCGLPIDHVLVGSEIRVADRFVAQDVGSDHRPVIVDFE